MSRIAYVNGRYIRQSEAGVSIEDRGYQFADGVYEVCEIYERQFVDLSRHLARLAFSLRELRIKQPCSTQALKIVLSQIAKRNHIINGFVYIQVTRGTARRDHAFPHPDVSPGLVVTAKALNVTKAEATAAKGIAVVTRPDIRWKRPDIKTTGLLANVLARQEAKEQGAYEAWLVDEQGFVTEGAATNAWIVTREGTIVTHRADRTILRGITRTGLLELMVQSGLTVEERSFSVTEAISAQEAFITGATTLVMPVVSIDGYMIGAGSPGPVALQLRKNFHGSAELEDC